MDRLERVSGLDERVVRMEERMAIKDDLAELDKKLRGDIGRIDKKLLGARNDLSNMVMAFDNHV